MRTFTCVLAAVMGTLASVRRVDDVRADEVRFGRSPVVTQMAFSADGRYLAAAYFRAAINRPGTNWGAFVVQWDLKTRERLLLLDAYAPIEFHGDGKTLLMGVYERLREPGRRMGPLLKLALWQVGEKKPAAVFSLADKTQPLIGGAAFHPDGKHVAAMSVAGDLLLWETAKPAQPVLLDATGISMTGLGWGRTTLGAPLTFDKDGKQLALDAVVIGERGLVRRRLTWDLDVTAGKAKRVRDETNNLIRQAAVDAGAPVSVTAPGGKLKAVARTDGSIHLFEGEGDADKPFRILSLDGPAENEHPIPGPR